jgi:diguanylate cyclase (GGDEF)-like protein
VLRRSDLRCRYGGDEFLVILPETPAGGAVRVAEWLRTEIEQVVVAIGTERLSITISVGVATADGEASVAMLINRADRALYQAKGNGRNCVRVANAEFDKIDAAGDREPVITTH